MDGGMGSHAFIDDKQRPCLKNVISRICVRDHCRFLSASNLHKENIIHIEKYTAYHPHPTPNTHTQTTNTHTHSH